MGDKKHIDRLFQENFKDFEVKPNDAVWDNIEAKLNKKKKRKVVPIWWRYAGVAALLLFMLTVGSLFFNNNDEVTPQVVDTERNTIENATESEKNKIENSSNQNTSSIANTNEAQNSNDVSSESSKQNNGNANQKFTNTSDAIANAEKAQQNNFATSKGELKKVIQNPSKSVLKENKIEQIAENSNPSSNNKSTLNKAEVITKNVEETTKPNNTLIADNSNVKEKNSQLEKGDSNSKVADSNTEKEIKSIEEAIQENEELLNTETTHIAANKWSIAPNAAPVYFNSLGKGSSIGEQFNNNTKSGEVNMSYGINARYAINKRLTVRSGVNRVNLGYNTNDVVAFNSVNASASSSTLAALSGNVSQTTSDAMLGVGDDVTIMSAATFKSRNLDVLKSTNTSINQSFGFIEIPLELQYSISTKRFGVNVIGGFSSLFLNDYEAVSLIEGERRSVQNNDNINNTSYSANFGLGLNYKVSEKINLNLEPMFKYQINMFKNTSGDFQPFFVGVYTGFGIKF
ncbi:MAG: hypothetical protein ACON5F_04860 [Jejuia sp.]